MKKHGLLNWIELSEAAFRNNVASLVKIAGEREVAVSVKANAYGHGLPETVTMLSKCDGVGYITLHTVGEAAIARQAGWNRKIMLLGPASLDDMEPIVELDIEPVIFERRQLEKLGRLSRQRKRRIFTHLKLETGTNRQGITEKELPAFADIYHKYEFLKRPLGASTHFANIEDTTSHEYAQYQLDNFNRMVKTMRRLKIGPKIRHTASSAALILFEKTRFELVRPGISAYGYWSSKETYLSYLQSGGHNNLFEPVLQWKARVSQTKQLAADSFVGYGCTYRTTSAARLVAIPIGYCDGYDRRLSNHAYVLIKGRRAPIRGRVCMNIVMADVTDIKSVRLDQEVTIIGTDGSETITANDVASWAGTINYEILARISPTIRRIIV
ncbi:MAG: alanine racemase [candidate division Zixibacteria bacterium]|nr:alanine racemase [candidate division Zixibacteria bacterium]